MQSCILKAVGAISKVTNALLELKNSKNLNTTTLNKNLSTMVHDCTDSLVLLSQVNTDLDQNRRDHIVYCLDNQYYALGKNVPADSEFLSGDDLPKRIMNVIANKKLFSTSKTSFQSYNPSFKSSKNLLRFLKILGIATKMGTKTELVNTRNNTAAITATNISNKKKTFKLVGPLKFHDNILTELQKYVENFKGGNLRYSSKNWYKYTKDKYISNVITNSPKLDLKQLPTQNSSSSYPLSSKENETISVEIKKLLKKSVILYSTPEVGEFMSGIFTGDKKEGNKRIILNLKKVCQL